ncbi:unnamed protein product [Amoebophrya sp. A120]|nr:unnamed protein product [Amoebophrya sp. A120]|eukprot:GSA120T00009434001.1
MSRARRFTTLVRLVVPATALFAARLQKLSPLAVWSFATTTSLLLPRVAATKSKTRATASTTEEAENFDALLKFLDTMSKEIDAEIDQTEQLVKKKECFCKKEQERLGVRLKEERDEKIPVLQAELKETLGTLGQLKIEIPELEEKVKDLQTEKNTTITTREEEKKQFTMDEKNLNTLIQTCTEAIKVLGKKEKAENRAADDQKEATGEQEVAKSALLSVQKALLQGQHSDQRLIFRASKTAGRPLYSEASQQLLQQSATAAALAKNSDRILGMLKQMRDNAETELAEATGAEKQKAASTAKLLRAKNQELNALQQQLDEKKAKFSDLKDDEGQAFEELENSKKSVALVEENLLAIKTDCDSSLTDLNEQKNNLSSEQESLSNAVKILEADEIEKQRKRALFLQKQKRLMDEKEREQRVIDAEIEKRRRLIVEKEEKDDAAAERDEERRTGDLKKEQASSDIMLNDFVESEITTTSAAGGESEGRTGRSSTSSDSFVLSAAVTKKFASANALADAVVAQAVAEGGAGTGVVLSRKNENAKGLQALQEKDEIDHDTTQLAFKHVDETLSAGGQKNRLGRRAVRSGNDKKPLLHHKRGGKNTHKDHMQASSGSKKTKKNLQKKTSQGKNKSAPSSSISVNKKIMKYDTKSHRFVTSFLQTRQQEAQTKAGTTITSLHEMNAMVDDIMKVPIQKKKKKQNEFQEVIAASEVMAEQVNKDQQQHEKEKDRCETSLRSLKQETEKKQLLVKNEFEAKIELLGAKFSKLKEKSADKKQELAELKEEIKELEEDRLAENEEFLNEVAKQATMTRALRKAIAALKQAKTGSKKNIKRSKSNTRSKATKPLEELLAKTEKKIQSLQVLEEGTEKKFSHEKSKAEEVLKEVKKENADLKAAKSRLEEEKEAKEKELELAQQELETLEKELQETQKSCAKILISFDEKTNERKNEVEGLKAVGRILANGGGK